MIQGGSSLTIEWRDLHKTEVMSQQSWYSLVAETGADVWFTPNWLAPWVAHFGKNRKVIAAFVFQDKLLVGVLPFVIDRIFCFGFPIKLAQLAGPQPLFGVLRLPILENHEQQVVRLACSELLTHHKCDCVSLAPISDAFGEADRLVDALDSASGLLLEPDTKPRGHTIIRLPETFDTYLSQLSRNRRNKYRKTKRVLENEHNVGTKVQIGAAAKKYLTSFIASHSGQWSRKGKLGHFSDWPGSASFYADFCKNSDDATDARLYLQTAQNDELVAGLFCFVAGKSCHALVPSRNENWSHLKLDIGLHAQFERIEKLIEEGVEVIDSGAGEYDYKASLKGETVDMHRFLISHPTSIGRFKAMLLRRYSDALNFAFYRIWYNKFAPKLRIKGIPIGPLWHSWIRTRV